MPPGLVRIFFEAACTSEFISQIRLGGGGVQTAWRQEAPLARKYLQKITSPSSSSEAPAYEISAISSPAEPTAAGATCKIAFEPATGWLSLGFGRRRVFSDVRSGAAWLSWLKWARADKTAAHLLSLSLGPGFSQAVTWAPFAFDFTFAQRKSLDLHLQRMPTEPLLKLHSDPQTALPQFLRSVASISLIKSAEQRERISFDLMSAAQIYRHRFIWTLFSGKNANLRRKSRWKCDFLRQSAPAVSEHTIPFPKRDTVAAGEVLISQKATRVDTTPRYFCDLWLSFSNTLPQL